MKLNIKTPPIRTHEGGTAQHINAEQQLRRSVMACMLWEDTFYESGQDIAARIRAVVPLVPAEKVAMIALEAREDMKLRHAPLLIVREMARTATHKHFVAKTLACVIQRADELAEFLAIYWADGKQPLSAQVKRGLASAFNKFNAYQLAKYNRDGAVKLRDVLFLSHAKPDDLIQNAAKYTKLERKALVNGKPHMSPKEQMFQALVNGTLSTPDTWEVALSGGADKHETFVRLIGEKKLGVMALLRNLRNMEQAGVSKAFVAEALCSMNAERVLPFRFIAAARAVPAWEDIIEPAMLRCMEGSEKLAGRTTLMIDVSGSMDAKISGKSDLTRLDAACGLAILLREICEDVLVCTFSDRGVVVPPRRGFALRDAIVQSQPHGGTYLGRAVSSFNQQHDRIIVITDEQAADVVPAPHGLGYMINVAAYQNGVGYGAWTHVDGWSEAIVDYIIKLEKNDQ